MKSLEQSSGVYLDTYVDPNILKLLSISKAGAKFLHKQSALRRAVWVHSGIPSCSGLRGYQFKYLMTPDGNTVPGSMVYEVIPPQPESAPLQSQPNILTRLLGAFLTR